MPPPKQDTLNRIFEGRARLDALLALAGSISDTDDIAEAFAQAQKDEVPIAVVISALFEDEPRFPKAADAAALYGNLFGLWDQLEAGEALEPSKPSRGPKPAKVAPLQPPPQFPKEGPSEEWLETAWRYLEGCPPKERTKLEHAFENRQDGLITWLDESGSDDQVYGAARLILFELFAMLELGAPAGVGRLDARALAVKSAAGVPQPLAAWAHEAVFQAATDEEEPLTEENRQQLERFVETALAALWAATTNGAGHGGQR